MLDIDGTTSGSGGLVATIEPTPEIFYAIYLMKKGGRLDRVSCTIAECLDIGE